MIYLADSMMFQVPTGFLYFQKSYKNFLQIIEALCPFFSFLGLRLVNKMKSSDEIM